MMKMKIIPYLCKNFNTKQSCSVIVLIQFDSFNQNCVNTLNTTDKETIKNKIQLHFNARYSVYSRSQQF